MYTFKKSHLVVVASWVMTIVCAVPAIACLFVGNYIASLPWAFGFILSTVVLFLSIVTEIAEAYAEGMKEVVDRWEAATERMEGDPEILELA